MTIAHDAATTGTAYTSTGTQTTSHAANASADAAVVLIDQNGTTADEVSGVTYGGVAMSRLGSSTDATEAGRVYIYFLAGITGGTQNVAMTTTAATNKQLTVATVTSAATATVVAVGGTTGYATGTSTSAANPSWTHSGLDSASSHMAYEVIHSGLNAMTTTPATGWTLISSTDLGTQGRGFARLTSVTSGVTSITAGWTASTADDFVGASVVLTEVNNYTSSMSGGVSFVGTRNALAPRSLQGGLSPYGSPSPAYASAVLNDMPTWYYRLNDRVGDSSAVRHSSDSLHAGQDIVHNATDVASVAGPTLGGTALAWSGSTAATASNIAIGAQTQFTVECWAKWTDAATTWFVYSWDFGSNGFYLNAGSTGAVTFGGHSGTIGASVTSSSTGYNDGQWHHLVGVIGNGGYTVYVDSVATFFSYPSCQTGNAARPLVLSLNPATTIAISDVAVWTTTALTSTQVGVHYAAAAGVSTFSARRMFTSALAATLGFVGGVAKTWRTGLAGALGFVGSVATLKAQMVALAGAMSFVGARAPIAGKALTGTITPDATATRYRDLAMSYSPVGYWAFDYWTSAGGQYTFAGSGSGGQPMLAPTGQWTSGVPSLSDGLDAPAVTSTSTSAGNYGFCNYLPSTWMNQSSGTIIAWIQQTGNTFWISRGTGVNEAWSFYSSGGNLILSSGQTVRITTSGARTDDNKVHMVAFTWTANDQRVFIDGVQRGTSVLATGLPTSTSRGLNFAITGSMDEVAFLPSALTPAQILDLYSQGLVETGLYRGTLRSMSAAVDFVGTHAKKAVRGLAGALSFVGTHVPTFIAGAGGAIQKALSGAVSFTGTQGYKWPVKALAGSLAFVGSQSRSVGHLLPGALTHAGSRAVSAARALSGGLTFTGAVAATKMLTRALTATLTFTGSAVRRGTRSFGAGASFVGGQAKASARALAGVLSFTGTVASGKAFARTLTGTLAFAGSATRRATHVLAAALAPTGAVARRTTRSLAAGASFVGAQARAIAHSFAGALGFVGVVASGKAFARALTATLTFTGSATRSGIRSFAAGASFVGSQAKVSARAVTGVLTFTGSVAAGKAFVRAVSGALGFSGANLKSPRKVSTGVLTHGGTFSYKQPVKALVGALGFVGAQAKRTAKATAGTASFTGTAQKAASRALAGALSFAGSVATFFSHGGTAYTQAVSATLTFTGSQSKRAARALAGALGFAGSVTRAGARSLAAGLTFVGSDAYRTMKALAAAAGFTGSRAAVVKRSLAGAASFVGAVASGKAFVRALTATLTFVGSQRRLLGKAVAGALGLVGTVTTKRPKVNFAGSLAFVGVQAKRTSRALAGVESFTGAVAAGKAFTRALTATLTYSGSQVRRGSRNLAAGLVFVGSDAYRTAKALGATLAPTGTVARNIRRLTSATLSFVGATAAGRTFARALAAALGYAGTVQKAAGTAQAGTLVLTGDVLRSASKALDGALTYAGGIGRAVARSLAAAVSFVGAQARQFFPGRAPVTKPSLRLDTPQNVVSVTLNQSTVAVTLTQSVLTVDTPAGSVEVGNAPGVADVLVDI